MDEKKVIPTINLGTICRAKASQYFRDCVFSWVAHPKVPPKTWVSKREKAGREELPSCDGVAVTALLRGDLEHRPRRRDSMGPDNASATIGDSSVEIAFESMIKFWSPLLSRIQTELCGWWRKTIRFSKVWIGAPQPHNLMFDRVDLLNDSDV
jgi:hypothetical protein